MARYLLHIALLFLLCGGPLAIEAEAQTAVHLSDRSITIRGERYLIHKVRKGETLYAIAKAYAVSQEEIMRANSLTRDVLRNKQTLLIPQSGVRRREQRPEPQLEPKTPSVPPRDMPRQKTERPQQEKNDAFRRANNNEQVVSSRTDTVTARYVPAQAQDPTHQVRTRIEESGATFGDGQLKEIGKHARLDIAVLLPMQPGMKTNNRFSEYYKGILLGLDALKSEGVSADVRFLNTGASSEKVHDFIRTGQLEQADLIIGPVYAAAFEPIAEFAAQHRTPVVSPLGAVGAEDNPYVFEAPPTEEYAYRRIFETFGGQPGSRSADANLVLIDHLEYPDTAALALIEAQLEDKISILSFTGTRSQSQAMDIRLNAALDKTRENIVYVPVNRPDALESILSHLSSINTNGRYRITVIGTPRWEWISNINLDLFYKLNVHYPASYHADRSHPAVAAFYREYMDAFGELPSPYAFRGYDVIRYFARALDHFGSDMPERIANRSYDPQLLQVGYDFRRQNGSGKYRNIAWPVVNYKPNYTIEVTR